MIAGANKGIGAEPRNRAISRDVEPIHTPKLCVSKISEGAQPGAEMQMDSGNPLQLKATAAGSGQSNGLFKALCPFIYLAK